MQLDNSLAWKSLLLVNFPVQTLSCRLIRVVVQCVLPASLQHRLTFTFLVRTQKNKKKRSTNEASQRVMSCSLLVATFFFCVAAVPVSRLHEDYSLGLVRCRTGSTGSSGSTVRTVALIRQLTYFGHAPGLLKYTANFFRCYTENTDFFCTFIGVICMSGYGQ